MSSRLSAIGRGAWGFGTVGVAAFSIWAWGSTFLVRIGGEGGLYAAIAVAFLGLSGLLLHPLTPGPGSLARFYARFIPAFLVYSAVWSAAWFALGFGTGELVGALAGSMAFVLTVGRFRGGFRLFGLTSTVLFLTHFSSYHLGGFLAYQLMGPHGGDYIPGLTHTQLVTLGKLVWGLCFGVGFGAGLGNTFFSYGQSQGENMP